MRRLASSLTLLLLAGPALGDPLPAVTLEEAVARALAGHPSVAAAEQEVRRSEAVHAAVRAAWLPSLTASGAYTRLDDDRLLGERTIAAQDQLSASLTLAVPLLAPQRWAASH